jgi:pimeloyl-ACP methyl ester carboxylesterase
MTTFALAHGAFHGAWCWELLTPLLEEAGHEVVAVDMPFDDGSATFEDCADVVCAALQGSDDDVVLVGHSFAGCVIPLVAARRPLRHLVYLCAVVPAPGSSVIEQLVSEPDMISPRFYAGLGELDDQMCTPFVDLDIAREVFYADCDDAVATAAVARLSPQSALPPSQGFTLSEFPSVRTTYVMCTEDRAVGAEWARRVADERLHADLVELPGGHSPFYSRPAALADVLLGLAVV